MAATIEIMGGLGNQLFQIFTLLAYSIKLKSLFISKINLYLAGTGQSIIGIPY